MSLRRYKDTFVAKGSQLRELMETKGSEAKKAAEKLYEATTNNAKKTYGVETYEWLMNEQKKYFPPKPVVKTVESITV
jgi:hypothetical protein